MIEVYKMRNMRTPSDKTYFIGFGDPLSTLAFWLERQVAVNPLVTNLTLDGDMWSTVFGPDVAAALEKLHMSISEAMSSKTAQNATVPIVPILDKTTTTLWTDIVRLGKKTPLHRVGPEHAQAPRTPPKANAKGPFTWVADRKIWGETTMGDTATPAPSIKSPLDLLGTGGALLDRTKNEWLTTLIRTGTFNTVLRLPDTGKDQLWWGQQIAGPEAKEINRMPGVVHAMRCFNVLAIGAYWRLQTHLLTAHALKTWLFGGIGARRPVYTELLREYAKYELDVLEDRLTKILELGLAPMFSEVCARIGWHEMRSSWGPRPAFDAPDFLRDLINGAPAGKDQDTRSFRDRGLLGKSDGPIAKYVADLHELVTTESFAKAYDRCKGAFGGKPPAAFVPPPGPLDAVVVSTDGMLASEGFDHQQLLDYAFTTANSAMLPVGSLPQIVTLEKLTVAPELSGPIGNVAVEERLLELADPRLWRPIAEYQGDPDAVFLAGGTVADVATTAGVDEAELRQIILNSPALWAHLFEVDTAKGSVTPLATGGIFVSSRFASPNIYRYQVPGSTRPNAYTRWLEARLYASGNAVANRQTRRWLGIATLDQVELSTPVTGAVEALLNACAINNPVEVAPPPVEALPTIIKGA